MAQSKTCPENNRSVDDQNHMHVYIQGSFPSVTSIFIMKGESKVFAGGSGCVYITKQNLFQRKSICRVHITLTARLMVINGDNGNEN